YEQRVIKRDGTEAIVQLSTSLVYEGSDQVAFQHIARDVTEQVRMQDNLRFYLHLATNAQEEERKRISHELHDETIQDLVVTTRKLDSIISADDGLSDAVRGQLEDIWQKTDTIITGVRRLSQDLRPAAIDRLGLVPAINWLATELNKHSGIKVNAVVAGTEIQLTEKPALMMFRIIQEALRNVWRHSQADTVDININFGVNKVSITVRDNGVGFSLPDKIDELARGGKLGLTGMQERVQLVGGTLEINSAVGKGTRVSLEIPV
ncbi:PAS domain-containing sensor histidine kinase, partial [Chloroflexota bacterium]